MIRTRSRKVGLRQLEETLYNQAFKFLDRTNKCPMLDIIDDSAILSIFRRPAGRDTMLKLEILYEIQLQLVLPMS
jgi:hypothetical protein